MIRVLAVLLLLAISLGWTFPPSELPDGKVNKRSLKKSPGVLWAKGTDRMALWRTTESQRVVRVRYPARKWGTSDSGAQFLVELPPRREYQCRYRARFPVGFDFAKGGKLPGLAGGTATTGLDRPTGDGWSARYMWRRHGELVLYLYHLDQRGRKGDDLPLAVRAIAGQWIDLKQIVTVNDPGKSNGRIQVFVDDQLCLDRKDLRLRLADKAQVDRFYFSTFFGGKGIDWAPKVDQYADFSDIHVSEK